MKRRKKRSALSVGFVVMMAVLVLSGFLLMVNGLSRKEQVDYLASLTPTPTAVPRKVSYIYDYSTPAPTALLIGNGREGPIVSAIQERLQALGYYQGQVDGQFGAQTRQAVIAFQQAMGLTADGLVGEETYLLLMEN